MPRKRRDEPVNEGQGGVVEELVVWDGQPSVGGEPDEAATVPAPMAELEGSIDSTGVSSGQHQHPPLDEEVAASLRAELEDGEAPAAGVIDCYVLAPFPANERRYNAHVAEATPLYREQVARAVAQGEQMGDSPTPADLNAYARAITDVRFAAARVLALGLQLPTIPGYVFTDGQLYRADVAL